MLTLRVFKTTFSLMVSVAILVSGGCCRDLAKSSASWSRTDEAFMSVGQMRECVQSAVEGSGLVPSAFGGGLSAERSSRTVRGSLTFVWRKGVWICTGAPLELVGGITLGPLLALPTGGWSLLALGCIWQNVDADLASNHMTLRFEAVDLGNGWTRGECTIESLGMTSTSRQIKKSLWAKLDNEFEHAKAPVITSPLPTDNETR